MNAWTKKNRETDKGGKDYQMRPGKKLRTAPYPDKGKIGRERETFLAVQLI